MRYYRAKIDDTSGTLNIHIAYSPLFVALPLICAFSFFGLLAWDYFSEGSQWTRVDGVSISALIIINEGARNWFFLGWLFLLLSWAFWFNFSTEDICVDPSIFLIRRGILGLGRTHEYDINKIKDVRLERCGPFLTLGSIYTIAFNYEDRVIRLGNRIRKSEAEIIVEEIQKRTTAIFSRPAKSRT